MSLVARRPVGYQLSGRRAGARRLPTTDGGVGNGFPRQASPVINPVVGQPRVHRPEGTRTPPQAVFPEQA